MAGDASVLARESFGQAVMGNVFGAMTMVSSIGIFAPGPGDVCSTPSTATCDFTFGASTVALAAVTVAFAFSARPQPRLQVA